MDSGGFSIKSIFGGGEDHDKLVDKSLKLNPLKEAVLECMRPFLISSIYCWTDLSIFLHKDYLFSRVGVISYREEEEQAIYEMVQNKFPSPEEVKEGKEMTRMKKHKTRKIKKKDPEQEANIEVTQINGTLEQYIKSESNFTHNMIINFLKPIAFCYPNQVINEVLTIWLKKEDILNNNVNLLLIKLIQLLSCLELPMYAIIGSLNYSIEKFGFESKKIAQKKKVTLDMMECKVESLIFFFLYTYTLHNLQNIFGTEDTVRIYNLLYRFLKYFQYSRHPTTICWMLDILYIISSKFSPTNAYKSVKKIKKEYQDIMQMLTENAARIISNDLNIDFAQDYLLDFVYPPSVYEHLRAWTVLIPQADKEVKESAVHSFLGPYIHTVRENMISYDAVHKISRETILMNELLKEDERLIKSMTTDNIVKFICDLIKSQIYDKHMRLPPIFLETFFCYYTVQTLKNLFFPLLHNIFRSCNQEKIVYNLDTIVGVIIYILQRKKEYPEVLTDAVTELFACLMDRAHHILVKTYRKQISEIFFSDYFFDSSSRALNKWSIIINLYMNYEKNDLIDDIINKWNTSAGMFTSKGFETKQKCTAIKRVAFLLYSSEVDKYIDKIDLLLKKMTENFKMSHLDYKVRIQLLLLCRIILLRLSHENLVESLRKLWPNLLNELINILEIKVDEKDDSCALLDEALKLIEILSLLNVEDFQLNQWIFVMDSYNIVRAQFSNEEVRQTVSEAPPKHFTPYIVSLLNETDCFDFIQNFEGDEDEEPIDNVDDEENIVVEKPRDYSISKNHSILPMSHVEVNHSELEIENIKFKADRMQVSASIMCIERTQLDMKSTEQTIEKDFIDSSEVKDES